ncbi:WRKY transcription factor [Actinidia chinensis var. chinensis]|uniref:WRKY transcription factor n=1 Tax=Actinidia chinensis var. chinensis TaxID=1590841 RepID=A0A2R6Q6D4_ACTCC|nr:WRKY transcription factor [Actinidia chinensis var. chinensis]
MNLNENGVLFCNGELTKNNYGDTTLRLECFGYGGSISAGFEVAQTNPGDRVIPSNAPDDGCRLVLGLGPTPNSYSDNYYPGRAGKSKGLAPILHQGGLSEGDSILKLGLSGGTDEVSGLFEFSVSTESNPKAHPPHHPNPVSVDGNRLVIPVVDEGSTSAKKSGGYMPLLHLAPRMDKQELLEPGTKSHFSPPQLSSEPSAVTDFSISTISEAATAGTLSDRRISNPKKCKAEGCSKVARGATGLCIGHGGGQRCQRPGCNKGAESRTAYCKAHGGGKRCEHLGCTKSAEGRTDYCIAHGGGRRCGHLTGCTKAARGRSGLCIKHGGGKRCKVDGCTRSAEGQIGLCISHGGGRRCQLLGCTKGAQGSTMFCKAHGGGKRCIFAGCTKGAEGSTPLCKGHGGGKRCLFDGGGICPKSVHGGTNFCVAHGGGKRCAVAGCTKSARGRTDCCVKHGGGKRCRFENCGKSAQGSTDFCKAHGGGKRCSWGGEGTCEKFARGKSGLCAAHSSMVQERPTSKGGMIGPGLFHGLVSRSSTGVSSFENNYSSSGASGASDSIDSLAMLAKRQHLIPPQVLVPLSMKCSSSYSRPLSSEKQGEVSKGGGGVADGARKSLDFVVTEGRVHGGGLMSLLGGNLNNAIDGI